LEHLCCHGNEFYYPPQTIIADDVCVVSIRKWMEENPHPSTYIKSANKV
jgi:hypothetical protein